MEKTKINKVFVIGTVQEVNTNIATSAKGKTYINGKVVVKSVIENQDILTEFKVLAFALNKDGSESQMYKAYLALDSFLNKKVKITGDLREGSIVDQTKGTLNKFNEVYLKFCNPAKQDDQDCSTFEYSGFVVKSLYERKNKDDVTLGWKIEVAQANYNNTNIQVLRFDVNKDDLNIIQAIEANYETGTTIQIHGTISYVSHTESKTEQSAFGEALVKNYVVSDKSFRITGGNDIFGEDDPARYTDEDISKYIAAYKASDVEKIEKAKNNNASDDSASASAPTTGSAAMRSSIRSSSLI